MKIYLTDDTIKLIINFLLQYKKSNEYNEFDREFIQEVFKTFNNEYIIGHFVNEFITKYIKEETKLFQEITRNNLKSIASLLKENDKLQLLIEENKNFKTNIIKEIDDLLKYEVDKLDKVLLRLKEKIISGEFNE